MENHVNYYCDKCEKEVETEIRQKTEEFRVKDEKITATITIRVCKECGQEVWDKELENKNEDIVYTEYRKKKGLLTPEEIKNIREKYGFSQSAFARVLGFGEKTITRYERGAIQDIAHNTLIRLMDIKSNMEDTYAKNKQFLSEAEQRKFEGVDKI